MALIPTAKRAMDGILDPFPLPGDADQDFDFDQLDLVQVQVAGKYLTGEPATWGEGDWNGTPVMFDTDPPVGDGVFNQLDIVAAQQAGLYLTGSYAGRADPFVAVPEPSGFLLAALGLLGVLACVRRPSRPPIEAQNEAPGYPGLAVERRGSLPHTRAERVINREGTATSCCDSSLELIVRYECVGLGGMHWPSTPLEGGAAAISGKISSFRVHKRAVCAPNM